MESTTPTSAPPRQHNHNRNRSTSRTRNPLSRPTTPLRAPSRTSLRTSTTTPQHNYNASVSAATNNPTSHPLPLDTLEPAFAELSDSVADLEANMLHLQLLHESLARFNENFGAFLYGLNMNAFTVDFTDAPGAESFRRAKEMGDMKGRDDKEMEGLSAMAAARDVDATFLTTDTSFVENPPTPRTVRSARSAYTPAPPPSTTSTRTTKSSAPSNRGASSALGRPPTAPPAGRGRGAPVVRGTRASQLAASRRETIAARGRGTSTSGRSIR